MQQTRRSFLKCIGTTAAIPAIVPAAVLGDNAPSKHITLGCIGMGGQGVGANLNTFLRERDARVLATCDAFFSKAERTRLLVDKTYGTKGCKAYRDFRRIIDDPSIDAVVISTPDHWHVPMSLMALKAGKDVFCEKPTLYIDEGRKLVDAVRKHEAVFQVGLEDRSSIHFHKMVEWVKNGAIGKLERIDVSLPGGLTFPKEEPAQPPEDLDWNLWQGPASHHDYTPNRTGGWHWRNISAYAKGAILDMGAHLVDTAQLGADAPGACPIGVEGTGEIPEGMETDVPVSFDLTYRYANGVEMRVKNGPGRGWKPNSCFLSFEGDKGWIRRKTWSAGLEASSKEILQTRYEPETSRHWPLPPREQRNFLDCVKSRKPTTYQASDMHLVSTTLHMGVIAIMLGRGLTWDTENREFLADDAANKLRAGPTPRDWESGA
jgi:predicted dehydrogenase